MTKLVRASPRQGRLRSPAEDAARLLVCPAHGTLVASADRLSCAHCAFAIHAEGGILAVDDGSGACEDSFALRLMDSAAVARMYEGIWRRALVRVVSPLTYEVEDGIVDRHLGTRGDQRIADLCCGTARASRRWLTRGATVVGVDRSSSMLAEARRRCSDGRLILVRADASRALLAPDCFDAVLCFASLHLMGAPAPTIATAARGLVPGGFVFLWALQRSGTLGAFVLPPSLLGRLGIHPLQRGGLRDLVLESGCEIVEESTFGAVAFVVGRKRPTRS